MIIRILTAAVSGLLFGVGLYIAQMTDPTKVLAFLDLSLMATGQWDPSLILVMSGGFAVMALAHLVRRFGMKKPLFDISFRLPDTKEISPSLLWGSALFGLGWGLAGYCPGPAIASLAFLPYASLIFVPAMALGSWGSGWLANRRR